MRRILKYIILIVLLFIIFYWGCPFYKVFGLTCPACGTTHSWIYLINGELGKAIKSNFFFIPLTISFVRIIYAEHTGKHFKKIENNTYLIIFILSFIYNIFRIIAKL